MRILLGIGLIVLAMVALFGIIVIPVLPPTEGNATIDGYLQTLLCQPGEQIIREQYSRSDRDGQSFSMNVYCENNERQREEVTGKWVLYGVLGFTLPFLVGLMLLIFGINRFAQRSVSRIITTRAHADGDGVLKVGGIQISLNDFDAQQVEKRKIGRQDLTARLQQLQDARDAGLISAEEYERLRHEVLDSFSD